MTYNAKIYGKLLAETLPGIIETDGEYERIEGIFNDLINKSEDNMSPEETRLFALLANLMEDYEKRTLPLLEKSSEVEMLRFLMRENNLKQMDLIDVFGTQSIVSEILNGKRSISKTHARRLAKRFSVSADLFI
jgi:HTH-type transcriptional regulator/antitoxin HigA